MDLKMPQGAVLLMQHCMSPEPEVFADIVKLIQLADLPPICSYLWPLAEAVGINQWWVEGEVKCREQGLQELAVMLPWLLKKVSNLNKLNVILLHSMLNRQTLRQNLVVST